MSAHRKNKSFKKKKQSGGDVKRLFKVLGLSLIIVLLLAAAVNFAARYTDWNLFGEKSADNEQNGMIYKIDADTVRTICPYGNGVAMLTNSSILYLDANGREIESNKHNFAAPECSWTIKLFFCMIKAAQAAVWKKMLLSSVSLPPPA